MRAFVLENYTDDVRCSVVMNSITSIWKHSRIRRYFLGVLLILSFICGQFALAHADSGSSLSEYETFLPHTTQFQIPNLERDLLKAYLDSPKNGHLAQLLAYLYLDQILIESQYKKRQGEILEHIIMAQYFIHRVKSLDITDLWLDRALRITQQRLDKLLTATEPNSIAEDHRAHQVFREAFHFKEQKRYIALAALLNDFVEHPNNVYTVFALTALNLWIGGEADYDDPTVLYNFVLGSYFSLRTIDLAQQLENAWLQDPAHNTRFRMASILGGFTALHRRWLASLHGDQAALAAIDNEHREWRLIHRSFHAFTVGIPFFEEQDNFQEGMFAVLDGFTHCEEVPVRTCSNLPRFSFNRLGFVLTLVDFFLKAGDLVDAEQTLQYRFTPSELDNWAAWDLGRDAWEHREKNLSAIAKLYQNNDPNDDPLHFQLKRRKWGTNTTTCQTCHQTQGKVWTEEEFNTIILPPEVAQIATVRPWPKVSTTWYGELIQD